MKTLIVQGDGFASLPHSELDGRTPLEVASTPNLDWLACRGEYGLLTLPGKASDLSGERAHLALLGYDPEKYFTGPASFEAAGLGVVLGATDVAYLCHLVTLRAAEGQEEAKKLGPHLVLEDEEAGNISSDEARELIDAVNDALATEVIQFYMGGGARHLMVWVGGNMRLRCWNPRAVVGKSLEGHLPVGEGSDVLRELMEASRVILRDHPVNQERQAAGLRPANCLWMWGQGKVVELPNMAEKYALQGVTISPTSLHLGIGLNAGLEAVLLDGRDEHDDSRYAAMVNKVVEALQQKDLVYLHCPLPIHRDGHSKSLMVEQFDRHIVGPLLTALEHVEEYRLLMMCNPAGEEMPTGSSTPIPFVLSGSHISKEPVRHVTFCERAAEALPGSLRVTQRLMDRLLARH